MNASIVKRLVMNDLYLFRWLIAGSVAAGLLSLLLATLGSAGFYLGLVSYVTSIIVAGVLLVMLGIGQERRENTWIFLLSLPLSPLDLALAKVVSNGVSFLVTWFGLLVVSAAFIAWTPLPNGLIPATVAMLVLAAVYYAALLGVALCSTSWTWITVTIIVGNVSVSLFMYVINRIPGMAEALTGSVAVWSPEIVGVIAIEAAAVVVALLTTWLRYARKREFI